MPKATSATVRARVEDILTILLDGAQPFQVRQYVSEKETAGEEPWTLSDNANSLSERQIRRYIAKAEILIAESCRTSRKKLLRRHLAQRRSLYARAVSQGDIRAALSVLRDEADLLCLYGGQAPVGTTPQPAVQGTADVVKLLGERLSQIDASELPITEKAKLTATLADALLRAIGVDVLDKRLEALQAVLLPRKDTT